MSDAGAVTGDELIRRAHDLKVEAAGALRSVTDSAALDAVRVRYINKGFPALTREIGRTSPQDRKRVGAEVNRVRDELVELFEVRRRDIDRIEAEAALASEAVDMTLPGRRRARGRLHPLVQTIDEMRAIFTGLGFAYDQYPEIQSEYYNFDALNTPEWHPARDMHDTFHVADKLVLRTHTSAFQNRVLKNRELPVRAVTSGRCYRKDDADSSHSPVFYQFDGIAVDTDITFGELKGTLGFMATRLFGADTEVRFRPSYFPFTTPSAEMDVSCVVCRGAGCGSCKGSGWLELLGCGMVHPAVLREAGVDPARYRGFAFGIGVDRIAMKRFGIPDIRMLYDNDLDLLEQF